MHLSERMKAASTLLAPYAVPHEGKLGREIPEPPDETRFPFQRDRDRIIHTQAFRRLQGKTQVFVAGEEGDHVRTRLTHTMEVAQIARDVARTLRLNEDLAECIALAHDLGHPPFGHRGEEALHAWMEGQKMAFEHNDQTLRVVTLLESRSPQGKGLNLNIEVLEGLRKHRSVRADSGQWSAVSSVVKMTHRSSLPVLSGVEGIADRSSMSLEAQVVDKSDETAYLGHDTDDGLRAGLFTLDEALTIPVVRRAQDAAAKRGTLLRSALIHLMILDLQTETERLLAEQGIRTLDDVYVCAQPLVSFSPPMQEDLKALRTFLRQRMYEHPRVTGKGEEGQRIITELCNRYLKDPQEKVRALQRFTGGTLPEAVKDYVAGMTDGYAMEQAVIPPMTSPPA